MTIACLGIGTPVVAQDEVTERGASAMQAADADLEKLTKELAMLVAEPGFRGFLRSEIAKSKNRENILELDKFLARASKRSGARPALGKFQNGARGVNDRIKNSNLSALSGFDLYIPVEAHRAKWKGGADFLVAFASFQDEKDIQQVIAYSVKDGRRVILDPNKAPDQVVLVLAPEEHESHEVVATPKDTGAPPKELKENAVQREDPPKQGMKEPGGGDSIVGVRYVYLYSDKEPWTRGAPEIKLMMFQRGPNNQCLRQYRNASGINNERVSYKTWDPWNSTGAYVYPHLKAYFDTRYWNKLYIYINEYDGGSRAYQTFQIYPGVTCEIIRYSGDDRVGSGYTWRSNFLYDLDYGWHRVGDARVLWRKQH